MTLLGIAVPSILLVAVLRRWVGGVSWRLAALFLAMTLLFLHGAVFTSRLPVPVDDAARAYPWRGLFGEITPRNPLTNDTVKVFLPQMQAAREELLHFRMPLWDRYSFSGYPLLASGQSAPLSPLLLATLFVPLPKQIVAMAGLKIFVALLFMYLLAKREGAGESAAIFAAVAYGWSTAMTIYLYFPAASVMAFLPAAAFALLRALDDPRPRSLVLVALVIAAIMANGHPESVLHVAIGCGGLLLIDLACAGDRRDWLRRVRVPLGGVAAGLALSAPAWVPLVEQILISARFATLRSGHQFGGPPTVAAWALVMPNGFGNPVRHNYSWYIGYNGVALSYAGLLVLVLFTTALIAPRTGVRQRLIGIFAVIVFLAAVDWTPLGHLVNTLPLLSIAANEKMRFVALFLAAVVAAKALDHPKALVAMAAVPAVGLAVYVYWSKRDLLRPIDLLGAAAVCAFFVLPRAYAPLLLGAELLALNAGFNALVDGRYFRPRLPIIAALKAQAPREPFRIAALGWTFSPNASAQYELEDIRGSDPMVPASYDAYLSRFTSTDAMTQVRRLDDPARPELDFLNVRFLLVEPGVELAGKWRERYRGPDGVLYENTTARARFFSRTAEVMEVRNDEPGVFSIRVRGPGLVVSSEVVAPGRVVELGGRRLAVRLVEGAFIGFDVPAGEGVVRLRYRPLAYRLSWLVAAAAAGVLALTGIGIRGRPLWGVPARGRSIGRGE